MSLTLTITSKQRQILGREAVKVTSGDSLSIGRSPNSNWTLPDPEQVVSGLHATIERNGADYILTDRSKNGTYVNDAAEPLGNGKSLRLTAGDRILIGDYEIVVTLDPTSIPAAPLGISTLRVDTGNGSDLIEVRATPSREKCITTPPQAREASHARMASALRPPLPPALAPRPSGPAAAARSRPHS